MTDILDLPIRGSDVPAVIAIINNNTKQAQVLHTKSLISLMSRLMNQLGNNKYRNREVQDWYNSGACSFVLLDTPGMDDSLILRYIASEKSKELVKSGYSVISSYNALQLKIVVRASVRAGVRVVVSTARNVKYSIRFSTVPEANKYLASTRIVDILYDATSGQNYHETNEGTPEVSQ
jgi:hypothetical protein